MITLTKVEINWLVSALQELAEERRAIGNDYSNNYLIRAAAHMSAGNLESVASKLNKALENDHRRIAIKR